MTQLNPAIDGMRISGISTGQVSFIDREDDSCWDRFVEKHPHGWIYHLSGWRDIIERCFKHVEGYHLALVDRSGEIHAALPIYEVRSWLTGNRLVSIPFGTLSDPLISSRKEMSLLFKEAERLARDLKIEDVEVRTFKTGHLLPVEMLDVQNTYKQHYIELARKPEELLRSFDRGCVRSRINKSLRSNLNLRIADSISDMKVFYRLYLDGRNRLGLPPQPYRFFKCMWDTFLPAGRMLLLLAETKGQTVAGLLLLKYKDRVSAEFLAYDEKCKDLCPNHFLFWQAMQIARTEGYGIFDFGRTSVFNETLMKFKSRWGTSVADLPVFHYPKRIYEGKKPREQSKSYRIMRTVCRKVPRFLLGPIGDFTYRHLA